MGTCKCNEKQKEEETGGFTHKIDESKTNLTADPVNPLQRTYDPNLNSFDPKYKNQDNNSTHFKNSSSNFLYNLNLNQPIIEEEGGQQQGTNKDKVKIKSTNPLPNQNELISLNQIIRGQNQNLIDNNENMNKNKTELINQYSNSNNNQYQNQNQNETYNINNNQQLLRQKNQNQDQDEEKQTNLEPLDEFSKYIFNNINNLREHPSYFIEEIENSKKHISRDKHGRLIYRTKIKVALNRGEPAFDEAIEMLKNTQPMNKLNYSPKLTITAPSNEDDIKNKQFFLDRVKELDESGIFVQSYWRDQVKDPEVCFILMIVDDSGTSAGLKRRDLLNPDTKYIGISSVNIGKSFACYILLSPQVD